MTELLLYLDPDSSLGLQSQIRALLIDAIMSRQISPGVRLPSTRQLAKQLGVSRNTVIAAVEDLIAEGYLISRERSGCYVNEEALTQRFEDAKGETKSVRAADFWVGKIRSHPRAVPSLPPNWSQYPFLFIEGQPDKSLLPVSEWRECARAVQGRREIESWADNSGEGDDPTLLEEIRTKLLPRRGINAIADEIMITSGVQGALGIIMELLARPGVTVGIESPGYIDARAMAEFRGAKIVSLPVDTDGVIVGDATASCDAVYTTPSHQFPTGVTMSMDRRKQLLAQAEAEDFLIIEDDYAQEVNFLTNNSPALRLLDGHDRVIYVSSLSKMLTPGIRIGFMVASQEFVRMAKATRRLSSGYPPNNNQRMAALFLSLGHYDALCRRLLPVHKQRWLELRRAVNYCFPQPHFMIRPTTGGTACWIEGPADLDVFELAGRARQRGILIDEPGSYLVDGEPRNGFRLSVSCIDVGKIRPGLERLAGLINEMLSGFRESLANASGQRLKASEIATIMPGAALVGITAYGDPYTVRIHADGEIDIQYQNTAQETDTGRWWIEGDQWWRQFTRSTYGEARGFYVMLDDTTIKWFDNSGYLIDTELFIRDYESES